VLRFGDAPLELGLHGQIVPPAAHTLPPVGVHLFVPDVDAVWGRATAAQALVGWNDEDAAREAGRMFARSILPRELVAMTTAASDWRVNDLLPRIAARTLIVTHTMHPFYDEAFTRRWRRRFPMRSSSCSTSR